MNVKFVGLQKIRKQHKERRINNKKIDFRRKHNVHLNSNMSRASNSLNVNFTITFSVITDIGVRANFF